MSGLARPHDAIAEELRRAHFGDAWHGPAVAELVHGLEAVEAAAHPVAGAHSIWEIVLHLAAWRQEVARRLVTGTLAAATEAVIVALSAFPAERLAEQAGGERDAALGSGVTWEAMLHGLAQHDAYHGGQIAILKRALAIKDER